MNKLNQGKLFGIAALLQFVVATFYIADGNIVLGAVFFGSATCFLALAGRRRQKDKI